MKQYKTIIISIFVFLASLILLSFLIKGDKGTQGQIIEYQTIHATNVEGPFESTNTNSRYALVEAIVDDGTFFLDDGKARFSAPDIAKVGNKFISLFTPGVSFLSIPLYMLGKQFGLPQFFTFLTTVLFGILNIYLIALLVKKIGGTYVYGLIGGLVFLFATNVLPYTFTLTQHQASSSIILLGLLLALSKRTLLTNLAFGAVYGIGMLIDFPNAFLLFPVVLYLLAQHVTLVEETRKIQIKIKTIFIFLLFGLIPFVGLFAWYNHQVTGSYTTLPQYIGRSNYLEPVKKEQFVQPKKEKQAADLELADTPFDTRLQLGGTYILLFSDERGVLYYAPVFLFGILGFVFAYFRKETKGAVILISAIIGTNILIYSTFGDPWGGWSYGPRYLIPSIAVSAIGIGLFINHFKRNIFLLVPFIITVGYGAFISMAAALTTNAIPPKNEALNLDNPMKYTYQLNFDYIANNQSSSLLYNLFLTNHINLSILLYILVVVYLGTLIGLYIFETMKNKTHI